MTGESRWSETHATDEPGGELFVYGTLMLPAVIQALVGRVPHSLPAALCGYRRYRVTGKVYPAIAVENAARVDGLVYGGLDRAERLLLDAFESSIYTRRRVEAQTGPGEIVTADAYVLGDDHAGLLQRAPAWSLEEFSVRFSTAYVRMCAEFRARWVPRHRC